MSDDDVAITRKYRQIKIREALKDINCNFEWIRLSTDTFSLLRDVKKNSNFGDAEKRNLDLCQTHMFVIYQMIIVMAPKGKS